jgi:hypothetical protein
MTSIAMSGNAHFLMDMDFARSCRAPKETGRGIEQRSYARGLGSIDCQSCMENHHRE